MNASLHDPEIKDLIITNMLKHVPTLGWSLEALQKGVLDTGYQKGDEYRVFLGNVDRALEYYLERLDHQMEEKLTTVNFASMTISDRIATAIMIRLRLMEEHKAAIRKTLLYLSFPTRHALGLRGLYNTVNAIWYAAGDQSTDFNFYTKRATLAAIYAATLHYWLEDTSEDSMGTRAYLYRRLDNIKIIPQIKNTISKSFESLYTFLKVFEKK